MFQDGYTPTGYPMWCAVMPDFENLQESPAGFDGDPLKAITALKAAVAAQAAKLTHQEIVPDDDLPF